MDDESGIFATIPEANVSLMSVREWQWTMFAAAALQGMLARGIAGSTVVDWSNVDKSRWSNRALDWADAMMAEIDRREKGDD